jgi:hypothetical protein
VGFSLVLVDLEVASVAGVDVGSPGSSAISCRVTPPADIGNTYR